MIQSWLNSRKQGRAGNGLVGIEASAEGLAIAHVRRNGNNSVLECCDFVGFDQLETGAESDDASTIISPVAEHLKHRIAALGLQRLPANWALNNAQYTLLLVEAPNVPAAEMREAVRWRVQELSPVPIEEATLDVFPLPEDGTRGGTRMVYVVVARKQDIETTIAQAQGAHLALASIDIAEMCLRNIAERVVEDKRGAAFLRIRRGSASLVLVRGDRLYLSRQFDLPYNGGLLDDLPEDNIVLELQRSLDYFERQMGQVPPRRIIFCGDHIGADKITDNLRGNLPAEPIPLQPQQLISGAENVDENILGLCVGAVGAALRQQVAA